MVKIRFAPSPTGFLHIGGARTCLFNWLYAQKMNGKFVLRIEDTDLERSKKEYLEEILESVKWLGMDWDEITYQSQRFDLYREYAQKLIKENKAYRKEGAIFFKYEFTEVSINDLIRGEIVFKELPKEEEVIIKGDNTPAYNFSCCIDDALSQITHVIRGEDHISNTPKQILMYKALGFEIPQFAHLPLILAPGGGRLSKRFGATSVREYKEEGYLSEAIVNYLLLLGWSPGNNQEIIALKEAKEVFDIKDVHKTGAAFSLDKLDWVNSEYIKNKEIGELTSLVKNYLKKDDFLPLGTKTDYLEKVVGLFKERITKFSDLISWAHFCFYNDFKYSDDTGDILKKDLSKETRVLIERMSAIDEFNKEAIEKEFRAAATNCGLKARDLVHPVRVALTGRRIGPGLFETMEVLGKERVLERLERLINHWKKEEG
ncbi:MAG: glutamate--tRNA ligase [Candidatus Omnitrophica bacterium]|nr:glutamate--tRNA ligase [Candidatus Omnitrophota bacterium]MBU2436218.1 glutamate--tRNA ligase [Candidatus Omnitrophota bacterium]